MLPGRAQEILNSHVTVHDRTQYEITFTYDVSAEKLSQGKNAERYRIEAYYFFPKNMGITPLNFPKDSFYRSLHGYVRFKTPTMADLELLDPLNRRSPLNVLSFALKRLTHGRSVGDTREICNEARLFGCIVSSWLKHNKREIEMMAERLHGAEAGPRWREFEGVFQNFLNTTEQLLGKYRGILQDYRTAGARLDAGLIQHLRQVDEYLTYRFDHTLSALNFCFAQGGADAPKGTGAEGASAPARLGARLTVVASAEQRYRQAQGYICIAPDDDGALALYTYRSGALKKLVEQVLYLDVKTIQENHRWRNLAAMAGAMVAALFAGYGDRKVVLQLYQVNLWLALALFALIYVAKDRMKEVGREYLWAKVARYFPDNRLTIHDPTSDMDIGVSTENVEYLAKGKVPVGVLAVRNFDHVIDLDEEREESVLVYRSNVTLNARVILAEHERRTDLKHILRFNVEDLLTRLDNPSAKVQFFDAGRGEFCRLQAPKVYHLNVVFRFTRWDDKNQKGEPYYRRIRLVLDKNGILRVENVVAKDRPATGRLIDMMGRARHVG